MRNRILSVLVGMAVAVALPMPAQAVATDAAPLKGHPSVSSTQKKSSSASRLLTAPNWLYAGGSFTPATPKEGTKASVTVDGPSLDSRDYHTLMEISVEKFIDVTPGDGINNPVRQIVELGWTVDRALNGGSTEPHLFGGAWVNDVFMGYNAIGSWVDNASCAVDLGDDLNALGHKGTQKLFALQYFSGNWWASYNNCWIGYWQSSMWTGATPAVVGFTSLDKAQYFGEVAEESTNPGCTDMGDGSFGSSFVTPAVQASDPSWFISAQVLSGGTWSATTLSPYAFTPLLFDYSNPIPSAIFVGGPGRC